VVLVWLNWSGMERGGHSSRVNDDQGFKKESCASVPLEVEGNEQDRRERQGELDGDALTLLDLDLGVCVVYRYVTGALRSVEFGRSARILPNSRCMSTGFVSKSEHPTLTLLSRSLARACAVSAMMGIGDVAGLAFIN
jgi:hypothetical protein